MADRLNKKFSFALFLSTYVFSAFSAFANEGGVYNYNSPYANYGNVHTNPNAVYSPIATSKNYGSYYAATGSGQPTPGYQVDQKGQIYRNSNQATAPQKYIGDGSNTAKYFNPSLGYPQPYSNMGAYGTGIAAATGGGMLNPYENSDEIYGKGWELSGSFNLRQADFYFHTKGKSWLEWDNMQIQEFEFNVKKIFPNLGSLSLDQPYFFGQFRMGKITDGRSIDDDLNNSLYDISVGGVDGKTRTYKLGFGFKARTPSFLQGFNIYPEAGLARHIQDLKMTNHKYPNPKYDVAYRPDGGNFSDDNGNGWLDVWEGTALAGAKVAYNAYICDFGTDGTVGGSGSNADTYCDAYVMPDSEQANVYNFWVDFNGDTNYDDDEYLGYVYYDPSNGTFETDGVCEYDGWNINGTPSCLTTGGYEYQLSGVTQAYKVTWDGLYIGARMERKFSATDSFSVYGDIGYYKYKAEADWPYRPDYRHPLSFIDEGNGYGLNFSITYEHLITENFAVTFGIDAEYFTLNSADSTLYLSSSARDNEGNIIGHPTEEFEADFLDEARWKSMAIKLGGVYRF